MLSRPGQHEQAKGGETSRADFMPVCRNPRPCSGQRDQPCRGRRVNPEGFLLIGEPAPGKFPFAIERRYGVAFNVRGAQVEHAASCRRRRSGFRFAPHADEHQAEGQHETRQGDTDRICTVLVLRACCANHEKQIVPEICIGQGSNPGWGGSRGAHLSGKAQGRPYYVGNWGTGEAEVWGGGSGPRISLIHRNLIATVTLSFVQSFVASNN